MSDPGPPSIRYVVFHTPGPRWKPGVDFREQDAGGMMVAPKDVSRKELDSFAAADPTV